jgi:hypothetical protein
MLTTALDHYIKIFEALPGPGVRHFLRLKTRAAPSARLGVVDLASTMLLRY